MQLPPQAIKPKKGDSISNGELLSVTLRDAQHLCWKTFTKIDTKLDPEREERSTPDAMVTDLLDEAGNIATIVKGLQGSSSPEEPQTREMLATELSDLLYIIFVLAEQYGVELENVFLQTVNDHILKFLK